MLDLSFNLISLLVIWSCNCNNATKNKNTCFGTSVAQVFWSTLNVISQWISKPRIKRPYKHRKASSGAGRFAQNLRACKKSQYDIRNCKSNRHSRRYTFKYCGSQSKPIFTNILYNGLIFKQRKKGNIKALSHCKWNRILRFLNHCQDITVHKNTKLKSSLLPFEELYMGSSDLSTNSEYDNRSNINFQLHHALNNVEGLGACYWYRCSTTWLLVLVALSHCPNKSVIKVFLSTRNLKYSWDLFLKLRSYSDNSSF